MTHLGITACLCAYPLHRRCEQMPARLDPSTAEGMPPSSLEMRTDFRLCDFISPCCFNHHLVPCRFGYGTSFRLRCLIDLGVRVCRTLAHRFFARSLARRSFALPPLTASCALGLLGHVQFSCCSCLSFSHNFRVSFAPSDLASHLSRSLSDRPSSPVRSVPACEGLSSSIANTLVQRLTRATSLTVCLDLVSHFC
jgi:hypothetical protein